MGPAPHTSSKPQIPYKELEDLYENAPCGYLSLEPGGRITRVNATFLAWTGYGADDLVGRRFQDLLNIAGKIYYETHFAPLLRMQGFFNEVALELVAKNSSRIPVLVNAAERRDAEGKPTFIRITVFNATDRRRYESELLAARNALSAANQELQDLNDELIATNEQLDQSNSELNAFYEALPVGIFRADASGKIVQASRRFCTLLGIENTEDWLAAISSEDHSTTAPLWQEMIASAAPFSSRFRITTGEEPERHIEMKAIPIPGSIGGSPAYVGLVEDVTEALHAEARKRQIDRDKAVRQLTGGFAHNLNGLLTVILGNLELLQDDLADRPRLHTLLDSSLIATQRAATLASRLLVYSGYTLAQLDNLEVDPCLQDIAKGLASEMAPPHRLTCDFNARGAVIELEADMLKEVIEELISNAIAATPEGGGIHLSTRLQLTDASGNRDLVIAVSDRGIGMDHATLDKAREPFFTTREVGKGMGLGLNLVDGVARIAGGELRLHSDSGKGTTVELHLPAPL